MLKERGDTESTNGLSCLKVDMLVVIVYVPDYLAVRDQVDLTVV